MGTTTTTEIEHQLEYLRQLAPEGATVYTILIAVSRSGMQRKIKLLVTHEGAIMPIGYSAAVLTGRRYDQDFGAVLCAGAGTDQGFDLVYDLASHLYGDGNKLRHEWI